MYTRLLLGMCVRVQVHVNHVCSCMYACVRMHTCKCVCKSSCLFACVHVLSQVMPHSSTLALYAHLLIERLATGHYAPCTNRHCDSNWARTAASSARSTQDSRSGWDRSEFAPKLWHTNTLSSSFRKGWNSALPKVCHIQGFFICCSWSCTKSWHWFSV